MKSPNSVIKFSVHNLIVEQIALSLQKIFSENIPADKVIEKQLKYQKKWGSRDRRFYAESVYECVRWWRKMWYLINEAPKTDINSLRRIWAIWWALENQAEIDAGKGLPQLAEFKFFSENKEIILKRKFEIENSNDQSVLPIRESIPDWLHEWGNFETGEEWPQILKSLNIKAPVDLRVNKLLINREKLKIKLNEENIETEICDTSPEALVLTKRKNVFISKCYLAGYFEVQDRASQKIAPFLDPKPGERIIDACAGAGGKSLHLATLMENKGKIISLDIHQGKLDELKKRARRNKIDIIETRLIDSTKVIKRLHEQADKVLLDVPCSGTGVLRRSPGTKWRLSNNEIESLLKTQSEILESYSQMVKVGGSLVYATCSIMNSENRLQVDRFLEKNSQCWSLEKELKIYPNQNKGDGFYAALLIRNK